MDLGSDTHTIDTDDWLFIRFSLYNNYWFTTHMPFAVVPYLQLWHHPFSKITKCSNTCNCMLILTIYILIFIHFTFLIFFIFHILFPLTKYILKTKYWLMYKIHTLWFEIFQVVLLHDLLLFYNYNIIIVICISILNNFRFICIIINFIVYVIISKSFILHSIIQFGKTLRYVWIHLH